MLREVPSPRLRTVDRELRRTLLTVGDELRRARVNAGLSQVSVARALNRSASTVSRVESGRARQLTMETLLRQAAVVGLVARVALYPAGRAVRDARQLGLEQRFRSAISAAWACGAEVPLPILGDLRAVDLVISRPGCPNRRGGDHAIGGCAGSAPCRPAEATRRRNSIDSSSSSQKRTRTGEPSRSRRT